MQVKPVLTGRNHWESISGDDLLLLDIPGYVKKERRVNFFRRYREDLVGFLLSWLVVGFLIILAWGIMQI